MTSLIVALVFIAASAAEPTECDSPQYSHIVRQPCENCQENWASEGDRGNRTQLFGSLMLTLLVLVFCCWRVPFRQGYRTPTLACVAGVRSRTGGIARSSAASRALNKIQ